jgi:hypothetical protein
MDENVKEIFYESQECFTIFVVEQRFAVGRGHEFFLSYKDRNNYIQNEKQISSHLKKIMDWILKKIPKAADLIVSCMSYIPGNNYKGITEVITALTKLFGLTEHQAVGPEVLDPIIIEEGKISPKFISKLISIHKSSTLQPVIIIILKDNNFERAKDLLKLCPHGINVKMIKQSGETTLYKVINTGAENIEDFLDSYANQCYSTCTNTSKEIILNKDWSENSIVKLCSPTMFKIRSDLIYEEKENAKNDINQLINILESIEIDEHNEIRLVFLCMVKLFKVFCNDSGGNDLNEAYSLAKSLQSDILLAHVYRYANYMPNNLGIDKNSMLKEATRIFENNGIEDHALYSENNLLINQFYGDSINKRLFSNMQEKAINNTPGLVGMSIIYNNTGIAHLYSGEPDAAIEYLNKGLYYTNNHIAQKIGIKTNLLISKTYNYEEVQDNELRQVIRLCFDTLGIEKIPFIGATSVLNIISIALKKNNELANELYKNYPIKELFSNALLPGMLGISSLKQHFEVLMIQYPKFDFKVKFSNDIPNSTGIRSRFIINNKLNPMIFNAWL